jgi:hypothetical protein
VLTPTVKNLQAVIVQLGCMAYEFYLLQRCNVSHMRLFSVFLALPSATVRLMAARQLQVDDDSREEVDEDELELAEAAAGGGGAVSGAGDAAGAAEAAAGDAPEKKQKSVRMVLEGESLTQDCAVEKSLVAAKSTSSATALQCTLSAACS